MIILNNYLKDIRSSVKSLIDLKHFHLKINFYIHKEKDSPFNKLE